jgi:4-hydroxyacetophenone monooxygenase
LDHGGNRAALRRAVLSGGAARVEPLSAVTTGIQWALVGVALHPEVSTLMWGHRSIEHSWYKSADGNVYILCPWRLVDYWNMTRGVAVEDHVLRR